MPKALVDRIISFADASGAAYTPLATAILGLSVVRTRAPTALEHTIYAPIFCLVLQGEKQILTGERTVAFARMESLIVSLDLPAHSRITRASPTEPYVALALELDPSLLRELAAEIATPSRTEGQAFATAPADAEIADAMTRLFNLSDKPQAIDFLAPLVKREIHYWLLTSSHGAMLRDLAHADSRVSGVARAIAAIRQDFTVTRPVTHLARIAGMSVSAFHDHFRTITGTSPLQFQKHLKLAEARRLIRQSDMPVTSAALAVGYESPTQFSREYSRLFGASPRQDRALAA